ncbi:uncharacterized protein [Typha angustifolia]|uniref:uncharacterized protein n=1 Tax=Typha angustifolia TaxID=59011 RepID=UPI003C2BCB30
MTASKLPVNKRVPWLVPFLNAKFYEPCSTRDCQRKSTIFCTVCMGKPFCLRCKDEHKAIHKDHYLLEVVKSTYQIAVKYEDIDFLEIKDIRINIINAKRIIFIHCRQTKNIASLRQEGHCIMCNWPLDQKGSYCSIECQLLKNSPEVKNELEKLSFPSISRSSSASRPLQLLHREPDQPKLNHSSTQALRKLKIPLRVSKRKAKLVEESSDVPQKLSYRKWSRKGVPQRSPFF